MEMYLKTAINKHNNLIQTISTEPWEKYYFNLHAEGFKEFF
jgi:hypothetical protein